MATTLVVGGTGKTGRRIVQRLEAGGRPVRVGTPSASPRFDWTDAASWPAALEGVGSVYVTYYPDLAEPFIDADDLAEVAVAALTGDRHVGQLYEVTGPRLLGWAGAVAEIAAAAGHPIRYLPVSVEDYGALLVEHQVPAEVVTMLTGVFAEVLDGRNAWLGDGVQRALGRPPGTSPTTPATPPPPASGGTGDAAGHDAAAGRPGGGG